MRKLSTRWVPRWLRVEQKRNRMTSSEHCLDMFKRTSKEFLRRFVTVDETWIHHYTPEIKEQSKQWTSPGERAPKMAKTVPSAGKVMSSFLGIRKPSSSLTILEGKDNHAVLCWFMGRFEAELMKNGPIWRRKKCSFTMTTHQLTHPQLPQQNWSNYATNCCLIHPILQILPHAIYFCFQTWKKCLVESDSHQTRKSSPQQRSILRNSTNLILWMAWKSYNIAGLDISSWKETLLRNKFKIKK